MPGNTITPLDLTRLGARQREMLRVICASGGATVREIHGRIPDPPDSLCGLRTQLRRLIKRGVLKARPSGRHSEMMYLPATSWADVQRSALDRIADEHFEGSMSRTIHELMRLAADAAEGRPVERRRAA